MAGSFWPISAALSGVQKRPKIFSMMLLYGLSGIPKTTLSTRTISALSCIRLRGILCIDYSRKSRKHQESSLVENVEYAGSRTQQDDVEYNELKRRVDGLVDAKDPVSRSVYIMRTELSLPYEEIAENLGISERTAKRKMRNMLEYLAESLEKYGFKLLLLFFLALIAVKIVL